MGEAPVYDVCIIGGGMAGMWLLKRLRQAGYSAILLEKDALGAGQSVRSQGIIHGGTKYALTGTLTRAADAIIDMPERWRACLAGTGEVDLSKARILSEYHYLWSTGKLGSRMAAFFASKAVRGRVDPVDGPDLPEAFRDPGFKGALFRLNEIVLDIPTVFEALHGPLADSVFEADCAQADFQRDAAGQVQSITLPNGSCIRARKFVFTAGEGNQALMSRCGIEEPGMQLRPLHMVMVRHRYPHPIYAHCLGAGSKPRMTITSHPMPDGSWVWYLGGDIAETGLDRDEARQIDCARRELAEVLPWIDLQQADWAAFHINRAEPAQSALTRPDNAFSQAVGNVIVAWPTKLALSPNLADDVLRMFADESFEPGQQPDSPPSGLHQARVAPTEWEQTFR